MSKPSPSPADPDQSLQTDTTVPVSASSEERASYVKLAMRNMVRKRGKSLQHFFLTTTGLLVVLVGLAYLTR
ncbi:MAG TPA: DUF3285 domain-containing protein [Waterburya sp.]